MVSATFSVFVGNLPALLDKFDPPLSASSLVCQSSPREQGVVYLHLFSSCVSS